ncbi:hypothetical protein C8F01DRAFT_1370843 [Mycena amicta]|nr:hypothetical protein C8F01DRAFT_1370843 [Mycena amicta]
MHDSAVVEIERVPRMVSAARYILPSLRARHPGYLTTSALQTAPSVDADTKLSAGSSRNWLDGSGSANHSTLQGRAQRGLDPGDNTIGGKSEARTRSPDTWPAKNFKPPCADTSSVGIAHGPNACPLLLGHLVPKGPVASAPPRFSSPTRAAHLGLNATLSTSIGKIEKEAGVKYHEALVALARRRIGKEGGDQKEVTHVRRVI